MKAALEADAGGAWATDCARLGTLLPAASHAVRSASVRCLLSMVNMGAATSVGFSLHASCRAARAACMEAGQTVQSSGL